ncbi:MAG: hypothetical protein AAGB11_01400 [Pseudomonadota bacterium]
MKSNPPSEAPSTSGMVEYDDNSRMQKNLVLSKDEVLQSLVGKMGAVDGEFVIADYGCGPGHSAVDAVKPSLAKYREISPGGSVVVRHVDQPGNDWNGLWKIVFGPDGYQHYENVRSEAVIGSFYETQASRGSVAIATCFAASHWSSRAIHTHSPGTAWFADLEGEARAEAKALARADWLAFMHARKEELRPGGCLMVATLGSVPDPTEINGVKAAARKVYRAIFRVADEMAKDGLLKRSAVDRFVFPLWFPTVDDLLEPIEDDADLKDAFEILDADVKPAAVHPDDVFADLISNPKQYGESYTGYVRGFGESSIRLHLIAPSADSPSEVDGLTDEYFDRFQKLYTDEPGQHAFENLNITFLAQRK